MRRHTFFLVRPGTPPNDEIMYRMLIVAAILTLVAVRYLPNHLKEGVAASSAVQAVQDFGEGTVPMFRTRLEAGASCAELISIRDTYTPGSTEVANMNAELREIGCVSVSSSRSR
jgi:hypothetical protein